MTILTSGTISATEFWFTFTLARDLKKQYWCGHGVVSYELNRYDFKEHMINLEQDAGVYLKHILSEYL